MEPATKPRVLFVDDEPMVLSGYRRMIGDTFHVELATSAGDALMILRRDRSIDVIVSDMRMTGMDGVALMGEARVLAPDAVRILVTAYAALDSAIAAVNTGQVFRFLTKPCHQPILLHVLREAISERQRILDQRNRAERQLRGCLETLGQLLSMANPLSYGRALRIQRHVLTAATELGIPVDWELEFSPILALLGSVAIPFQVVEKMEKGAPLTSADLVMLDRLPATSEQLLGPIPGLERVHEVIRFHRTGFDGTGSPVPGVMGPALPMGSRLIKVAVDLDLLESGGHTAQSAFAQLRDPPGRYDESVLAALERQIKPVASPSISEIRVDDLRPGMVLAQEIRSKRDIPLVARGQLVTASLLMRLRNFAEGVGIVEPIKIRVDQPPSSGPRTLPPSGPKSVPGPKTIP